MRINHYGTGAEPAVGPGDDAWVRCVAESAVWRHVPAGRDVEPYRRQTLAAVRELARLRDEAAEALADDPWQDHGVAVRFAERVGWLLGDGPADLYPAEAALLVVMPFLYRVRALRLAAERSVVRPTELAAVPEADAERAAYEQFIESHDLLTHRARMRPEAARTLGWWLFHRWLAQNADLADPEGTQDLLGELAPAVGELGETFSLVRVAGLLHGLRRGPDIGNRDYLDRLRPDDHLRAPGDQHVREQRLALLLALAYGVAIEMTALPDIIAEHLGIPHEVDLAQLRRTLADATWGGSRDLPVLRAECHHEAVVEALREYTARADELLHAVRRVPLNHPLPPLPTRLTSDDAAPASGAFTGWARFRMDERKVRSLLMGVELYRDRDLAIRELYQNALDACRYRRARTQYLDRTSPLATYTYDGRIEFRQDVDEEGRAYLECQDNGVGMGEAELRGVFSNAGARFAEQLDFKLERAAWRKTEPPVELYPNSRFGIGVLSYFMLADEIRVMTCRMDAKGGLGPLLEVSIHGPGHLFRIVERSPQGREPGTTVRLYLRDDIELGDAWSCLDVLERLLGMAEFGTTVRHGEREAHWEAGVLRLRRAPKNEDFGLNAWGRSVTWEGAPDDAQVAWCEQGGALLVDGLIVEPEVVRGVLSRGNGGLTGVMVNLSGRFAPGRLSVDRRRVIDDVSETVGTLLDEAVRGFAWADSDLLGMEWIKQVAVESHYLADLVAAEMVRRGHRFEYGGIEFDSSRTGCFPADVRIIRLLEAGGPEFSDIEKGLMGDPPDHILLWRLLAHGDRQLLSELGEVFPEIHDARNVRAAMPSDWVLLTSGREGARHWRTAVWGEKIAEIAEELRVSPSEVDERAVVLGISLRSRAGRPSGRPPGVADLLMAAHDLGVSVTEAAEIWSRRVSDVAQPVLELAVAVESDPLFLRELDRPGALWRGPGPGEAVAPGYLAKASRVLEKPVSEICEAFSEYGLLADGSGLSEFPSDRVVALLSDRLDGESPWLDRSANLHAAHLLRAMDKLGMSLDSAVRELAEIGFQIPELPADANPADLALFKMHDLRWIDPDGVRFRNVFELVRAGEFTLEEILDRCRSYGAPISRPKVVTRLDRELFLTDGVMDWAWLHIGEAVPFYRLMLAASRLHQSPSDLVLRLNAYGIAVSCDDLPPELSLHEALEILGGGGPSPTVLSEHSARSLAELLGRSRRTGRPLDQIASWLREWGVPVPDLAETIRAALALVPLAAPA